MAAGGFGGAVYGGSGAAGEGAAWRAVRQTLLRSTFVVSGLVFLLVVAAVAQAGEETASPTATASAVPSCRTPNDCDDGNKCTYDFCDAVMGCQHTDVHCNECGVYAQPVDFLILVERAHDSTHAFRVEQALDLFLQWAQSRVNDPTVPIHPRAAIVLFSFEQSPNGQGARLQADLMQGFTIDLEAVRRSLPSLGPALSQHTVKNPSGRSEPYQSSVDGTLEVLRSLLTSKGAGALWYREEALTHIILVAAGGSKVTEEDQRLRTQVEPYEIPEAVVRQIEYAVYGVMSKRASLTMLLDTDRELFLHHVGNPYWDVAYEDGTHFVPGITLLSYDIAGRNKSAQALLLGQGVQARSFKLSELENSRVYLNLYRVPRLPPCNLCRPSSCDPDQGCVSTKLQCAKGESCLSGAGCVNKSEADNERELRQQKVSQSPIEIASQRAQRVVHPQLVTHVTDFESYSAKRLLEMDSDEDEVESEVDEEEDVAKEEGQKEDRRAGDAPMSAVIGAQGGGGEIVEKLESENREPANAAAPVNASQELQRIQSLLGQQEERYARFVSRCPPLVLRAPRVPGPISNHTNTTGNGRERTGRWSLDNLVKRSVPVREWSPENPFVYEVINTVPHTPVILRNTVASTWPAVANKTHKWTMQYLLQHMSDVEVMEAVKVSRFGNFTHVDEGSKTMAHMECMNAPTTYATVNMSRSAFFQAISNETSAKTQRKTKSRRPTYFYYFGELPASLQADVPSPLLFLTKQDAERAMQFLWISTAGVNMHTHFDFDHNIFVQIRGTKRFTLFPPTQMDFLYPYPRVHPLWHKSQVDFDMPDLKLFPEYVKAEAMEAVLEPGDVLYVPPLWWHHVESVTESVSLSTWSHGNAYAAVWAIYGYRLKADLLTNIVGRIYALRLFLDVAVRKLFGTSEVIPFFDRLVETRFRPLKPKFKAGLTMRRLCKGRILTAQHVYEDVHFDVRIILEHFGALDLTLRDIIFMDYIEEIAVDIVGADNMYGFFRYCFRGQQYELLDEDDLKLFS